MEFTAKVILLMPDGTTEVEKVIITDKEFREWIANEALEQVSYDAEVQDVFIGPLTL